MHQPERPTPTLRRKSDIVTRVKNLVKWIVRPKTLFLNERFTKRIIRHYCVGLGCEIGPGVNPQAPPDKTIFVDRYANYLPGHPILRDVQADAMALPFRDGAFDFLVSSHALEHCPDTLRVLEGWCRTLRPGGLLVLRLPHRDRTFDRDRPTTTLKHHIEDYRAQMGYDDETHRQEFLELAMPYHHSWKDLARKSDGSWDIDYIVGEGKLHYHVWRQTDMVDILRHLGLSIRFVMDDIPDRVDSFLIVAETPEHPVRVPD
jgi:SAM-dependent methyltransferase